MANIVEFLVKIRDLASGQMRSLATNTEGVFNRMSSRINRVGSSVDQLNNRINELTRTRDISLDSRQINRANREIAELERRRDRLTNSASSSGGGLFKGALIAGGIGLLAAAGSQMLKGGIDRSIAGISFEVMAGKGPGDKLHKNLMQFASDTIYGNEVFGEAKTMLGFGIQAKNVMPSLKMLGDIAMGDVEHMKSLTLAFSQSASAGKLTGQDLLQYVNAGFNPMQAISEKTGKKMADLRKEMEKGKISFRDVAGALEYATGPLGRFHNGMQRIGETPAGKWIAFKGALETLAGTIGMQLLPALGGIATFLNGLIGQPQLLENIATAIGAMTLAWGLYTIWVERAKIQTWLLEAAAMWPLALVGIIGYAYADLNRFNDDYAKNTAGTFDTIKNVGDILRRTFEDIIYWTQTAILHIQSFFEHIANFNKASSNPIEAWKALTADTEASKKLEKVRIKHEWDRANDMAGLDSNGKPKKASWMDSKLDFNGQAGGGGAPGSVTDTAKGIAGGGVRNLTINIAKQGIDTVTIHATTLTEGVSQIRETFIEMFNQVINSGNAAVSPQ